MTWERLTKQKKSDVGGIRVCTEGSFIGLVVWRRSVCDGVVYNAVGELYSILCSIIRENTKSSRSSCLPYLRYLGRWLTEGFQPAYSVTIMHVCIVTFALVVGVTLDS